MAAIRTPEQEIIDESGELYRSDLVVDDGKRITVVEYKTGAPTPAHEIQLQRYMRLISKAGAPACPRRTGIPRSQTP